MIDELHPECWYFAQLGSLIDVDDVESIWSEHRCGLIPVLYSDILLKNHSYVSSVNKAQTVFFLPVIPHGADRKNFQ